MSGSSARGSDHHLIAAYVWPPSHRMHRQNPTDRIRLVVTRCVRAALPPCAAVWKHGLPARERPRKPEAREHRVLEASHRTNLTAGECEHEKADPVARTSLRPPTRQAIRMP